VPIDVSAEFLRAMSDRLGDERPGLRVVPVVADMSEMLPLPRGLARPALFALLGSTIGNFDGDQAVALLRRVRQAMRPEDRFLLGVDLVKDPRVIEAAYNDTAGVTAEFNRNILRVLDRELGATFDPHDFAHRAFYDRQAHRIEMHLVARRPLCIRIPGVGTISFQEGESIRTEISCKYDRETVSEMLAAAGMRIDEWITGEGPAYALALASPAP
jgi:L-histidine N-alpha-methyltransferase